jgi:hypothetical protein
MTARQRCDTSTTLAARTVIISTRSRLQEICDSVVNSAGAQLEEEGCRKKRQRVCGRRS